MRGSCRRYIGREQELLGGVGRVGERGVDGPLAAVADDLADEHLAQLVGRADLEQQDLGERRRRRCPRANASSSALACSRNSAGCSPSHWFSMRRALPSTTAPNPERDLVLAVVVLGSVELEVLVVEGVDQLVDDGLLHVRRGRASPDHELVRLGVVEAEHAGRVDGCGARRAGSGRDRADRAPGRSTSPFSMSSTSSSKSSSSRASKSASSASSTTTSLEELEAPRLLDVGLELVDEGEELGLGHRGTSGHVRGRRRSARWWGRRRPVGCGGGRSGRRADRRRRPGTPTVAATKRQDADDTAPRRPRCRRRPSAAATGGLVVRHGRRPAARRARPTASSRLDRTCRRTGREVRWAGPAA